MIDNNRSHKDWYKTVEKLANNPSYVAKLKENMNKHISENYNLDKITLDRANWYKEICKKNE